MVTHAVRKYSMESASDYFLPRSATSPSVLMSQLRVGSQVELIKDPSVTGVIRWIGNLPDINGDIAGIELVGFIDKPLHRDALICYLGL